MTCAVAAYAGDDAETSAEVGEEIRAAGEETRGAGEVIRAEVAAARHV